MTNDEGLDNLLNSIKKSLAKGRHQEDTKSVPSDIVQRIRNQQHRSNLASNYIDGDLRAILLPLSESESVMHISNLDEIVVEQRRDSVRGAAVYTFQDASRNELCERVAQTILLYRDQFPANYNTELTKKEKTLGWGLIATILPSSVLEFISKERVSPSGERTSERIKALPGVAGIVDATKVGLGVVGGLTGAGIGSLAGPPGAIALGLTGFAVGYFSPAIAGGTYIVSRRKRKINEKQEYARIRNTISNISNQVRLQEVPISIAILPDFAVDNIQSYLDSRQGVQIFRQPTRNLQARWLYDAFRSVVGAPDIFSRVSPNMQRYYRQKMRDYEAAHNVR